MNEIVNERKGEIPNESKCEEHRFDFPGDECGCDEPSAKRRKNVLG